MEDKFRVEYDKRNSIYKIYINDFIELIDNNYLHGVSDNAMEIYRYTDKDINLFKDLLIEACDYIEYEKRSNKLYLGATSFDDSYSIFNIFHALLDKNFNFERTLEVLIRLYSRHMEDSTLLFKDSLQLISRYNILANRLGTLFTDKIENIINNHLYIEVDDIDEIVYADAIYMDETR